MSRDEPDAPIPPARARAFLEGLRDLVETARRGRTHEVLGYDSWTAYLADVLGTDPVHLPRAERRELVAFLYREGLSHPAVARVVGVSVATVKRDLSSGVADRTNVYDTAHRAGEPVHPRLGVILRAFQSLETGARIVEDATRDLADLGVPTGSAEAHLTGYTDRLAASVEFLRTLLAGGGITDDALAEFLDAEGDDGAPVS